MMEPGADSVESRRATGVIASGPPLAFLVKLGRNHTRLPYSGHVHSGIASEGEEIAGRREIRFHMNTGADVESVVIGSTTGSDNYLAQAGHPGTIA